MNTFLVATSITNPLPRVSRKRLIYSSEQIQQVLLTIMNELQTVSIWDFIEHVK